MNPGRLKKKMAVYRYSQESDTIGQDKPVLKFWRYVWAEMHPSRGTEFLEYYRDSNQLQYKVTTRYFAGLTEKDVLVYHDRQFEINAIINVNEQNTVYEIQCTEMKDKVITSE